MQAIRACWLRRATEKRCESAANTGAVLKGFAIGSSAPKVPPMSAGQTSSMGRQDNGAAVACGPSSRLSGAGRRGRGRGRGWPRFAALN
jgi:hypothetical protein